MYTKLCGLARTRNLAGCLEQAPAECGISTEGGPPMVAKGKYAEGDYDGIEKILDKELANDKV